MFVDTHQRSVLFCRMAKVLVLGASGLLGSEVYRICKESESIQVCLD